MAEGVRKRALITGVSGCIGRVVTERLLASNRYDIKVQARNPLQTRNAVGNIVDFTKVQMEEADFTRVGDREMRLLTKNMSTIVHCAGLVHQPGAPYQEYEVVNVRATQLLAEAAANNNVNTLVFLSSSAVYGPGPYENAPESTALKGVTPYAVSKMASEQFLLRFGAIPRLIILRPSLVYGEGDRGNLISLAKSIKEGKYRHIGDASTGKSIIYAKDVALAIQMCLDKLPEGIHVLNVANPKPVTVKELTEELAGAMGMPKKLASVPEMFARIGAKIGGMVMQEKSPLRTEQVDKLTTTTTISTQSLVSSTGFEPKFSLESGLRAEIKWAQENKLL